MKFNFVGIDPALSVAFDEVKAQLGIETCTCGVTVNVKQAGEGICIEKCGDSIAITYGKKVEFFRALSQLKRVVEQGIKIEEKNFMTDLCFMADVSRNAVYNMASIKRMIRFMALMGYTSLMMYTEDTFEVEGYPYFGHMRGKYSKDELREIDDYAYSFGIEVIPCIQTLAHLTTALRWPQMEDFTDTEDIMMVGDDRTYAFIDAMLKTCLECFRSRKINIGMDEAHNLGFGKYYKKNGYVNQHEIMLYHLNRVTKMCHEVGYHPMIWSDMFFRMVTSDGRYCSADVEISQDVIDKVPEGLTLVYWDYHNKNAHCFEHMVDCHLKFTKNNIAFAGGAWKWSSFAANSKFSIRYTELQLKVCREKGLREILVTCWGDDGSEAAQFSPLAAILYFAEAGYAEDINDEKLNLRAVESLGISYDDLLLMDEANQMPDVDMWDVVITPTRYLLFNDPLEGLCDYHLIPGKTGKAFADNGKKLEKLSSHPEFGYMYDTQAKLCRALELKAELSYNLKAAYKAGDKEYLAQAADNIIPEIISRINDFVEAFRKQWFYENKTFGFTNQEVRIGGQLARLNAAILRLKEYLNGEVDRIEELEQPILPFTAPNAIDRAYPFIRTVHWRKIATVGVMQ